MIACWKKFCRHSEFPHCAHFTGSIFLSTAPKYRGVQGLLRKHYVLSHDGVTAGGVYLWNSRPEAEAMYTASWRSFVREKYGTDPTVTYFESPVVVDNVAQQILTYE